ncbi:MAG: sigma-70 family RNA polymerase sigma factor [Luteolibacter sp.]|uniref:RNA polymerase sigma factor n=1 Tax=Luteolibacter sp. TaxID=1962973 RepID=UPI0032660931
MQETDGHLLTRFASHRDEAAFDELTGRYLGLIYHVALRRTGDRQIAEEVSQNVLCAVVRKAAGLARHPDRLPAWLHRATLFESSKAMRSEASHQRRKQLVHPDGIATTGDADSSAWNTALPVLDLALDRLRDSDRRILLRHYFEGKSFNQIGDEVSRPAATVQKQCRRALDKLSRILRGKGVMLSAVALTSGLAAQSANAAPPALLKSVAAKALAGAAAHSTTSLTLFMAMKSKATLPIALLILLSPLGLQQLAISRAAAHNDRLRESLASQEPAVRRASGTTATRTVSTGKRRITIDILQRAQQEADRTVLKRIEFEEMLATLGAEELETLIPQTFTLPGMWQGKTDLLRHLITALAKIDPGLAVRTACSADPQQPLVLNAGVQEALYQWTAGEPEAAVRWLEEFKSKPAGGNWHAFMEYQAAVAAPLILSGSPLAREIVTLSDDVYPGYVLRDAMGMLNDRTMENAATADFMVDAFAKFLPWIREFIPEDRSQGRWGMDRRETIERFLFDAERQPVDSPISGRIMETLDLDPSERRIIAESQAMRILETPYNTHPRPDRVAVDSDALAWLQTHIPDDAEEIFTTTKAAAADRERGQIQQSLKDLAAREVIRDGDVTEELNRRDFEEFPEFLPQALEQARRIKDPTKRAETILRFESLQQKLPRSNP